MNHCPPICWLVCALPLVLFWLGSAALMRYCTRPERCPIIEEEAP